MWDQIGPGALESKFHDHPFQRGDVIIILIRTGLPGGWAQSLLFQAHEIVHEIVHKIDHKIAHKIAHEIVHGILTK